MFAGVNPLALLHFGERSYKGSSGSVLGGLGGAPQNKVGGLGGVGPPRGLLNQFETTSESTATLDVINKSW